MSLWRTLVAGGQVRVATKLSGDLMLQVSDHTLRLTVRRPEPSLQSRLGLPERWGLRWPSGKAAEVLLEVTALAELLALAEHHCLDLFSEY